MTVYKSPRFCRSFAIEFFEALEAYGRAGESDDRTEVFFKLIGKPGAQFDGEQKRKCASKRVPRDRELPIQKFILLKVGDCRIKASQSGGLIPVVERSLKASVYKNIRPLAAVTEAYWKSFEIGDRPINALSRPTKSYSS